MSNQFHSLIKLTDWDYDCLEWDDGDDYYHFLELMHLLDVQDYDFDGPNSIGSSLLWFEQNEWKNAILRLKNFYNEPRELQDDLIALLLDGPSLPDVIDYMEKVLINTPPDRMIHLAWW